MYLKGLLQSKYSENKYSLNLGILNKNPLFIIGLIIRIFFVIFFLPKAQEAWFLPFYSNSFQNLTFNPWDATYNLNQNYISTSASFPYGIVMYLGYLPLTVIGFLLDKLLNIAIFFKIGFGLTSLIFDYSLLIVISKLVKKYSINLLLIAYWLSPLSIFIIYLHGQIDVLPVLLLIFGISFLQFGNILYAGILLAMAISAKLSMTISIPLILIYIYKRPGLRDKLIKFLILFLSFSIIFYTPWIFTDSFLNMVMFPKEVGRVLEVYIIYGDYLKVYLLPTFYTIVIYLLWRVNRITFDLFIIFTGLGFFTLLILLPPSPGWFLWVLPFLVFFQVRSKGDYFQTLIPFSIFFLIYFLIYEKTGSLNYLSFSDMDNNFKFEILNNPKIQSVLFTFLQASGLVLCLRMYIFGLRKNQYYQNDGDSLILSISNKSEEYRFLFLDLLKQIYYDEDISYISEDSYRNFEGYQLNNLNNKKLTESINANKMSEDIFSLVNGEYIFNQKYNQETKKFVSINKIKPSNTLLIGTSTINFAKKINQKLNLKICLEIDPKLKFESQKKIFILRKNKDSRLQTKNKKLLNIENNINKNYDIIFKLKIINPISLTYKNHIISPKLKLEIVMTNNFFYQELIKGFIALCSMHVDLENINYEMIKITLDGEIYSDDIQQLSTILIPNYDSLINTYPKWNDGMLGIIQLITLLHISESLHK